VPAAAPPHERGGDAEEEHADAEQERHPEAQRAEPLTFVQGDAWADGLGNRGVLGVAVASGDRAGVLVDVHDAFLADVAEEVAAWSRHMSNLTEKTSSSAADDGSASAAATERTPELFQILHDVEKRRASLH
jgi:hypothetical protein